MKSMPPDTKPQLQWTKYSLPKNMKITEKTLLHAAIKGASIALQIQESFHEGKGPPDHEAMRYIVEEAHAQADSALEIGDFEPPEEFEENLSDEE